MSRLSRYILLQSLRPLIFFTAVLTAIVWLTQSLKMLELVINRGHSLLRFVELSILMLPFLLATVMPLALFGALLFTLYRLYSESELVVMWSVGAGWRALLTPVLILGLVVTALGYLFNLYLMPAGYRSMKEQVVEIRTDLAASLLEEGNFNIPVDGLTVYIRSAPPGGDLRGILIHDSRDLAQPRTYMAERGVMVRRETGPHLVLEDGTIQWMNESAGELTVLDFEQYTFDLSPYMQETGTHVRDLSERYLHELFSPDMSVRWVQRNEGRLIAEGHNRLASPLYALAFALIAYVGVVQAGFSRRGAGRQVAAAVVAVILIRLAGFGVQGAAGSTPALNPLQYVVPFLAIAVPALWIARVLPGTRWRAPPGGPPADAEAAGGTSGETEGRRPAGAPA